MEEDDVDVVGGVLQRHLPQHAATTLVPDNVRHDTWNTTVNTAESTMVRRCRGGQAGCRAMWDSPRGDDNDLTALVPDKRRANDHLLQRERQLVDKTFLRKDESQRHHGRWLRCHGHPLSPYTLSLLSPSPLSSSCRGKRHHKEPHAGVAQTATVQRTPRPEVRSEEASG